MQPSPWRWLPGCLQAAPALRPEHLRLRPPAAHSAGSSSAERERITVRVFRSKASHEVAMDQMDVFKVMGEMFNIDFEFDNPRRKITPNA